MHVLKNTNARVLVFHQEDLFTASTAVNGLYQLVNATERYVKANTYQSLVIVWMGSNLHDYLVITVPDILTSLCDVNFRVRVLASFILSN